MSYTGASQLHIVLTHLSLWPTDSADTQTTTHELLHNSTSPLLLSLLLLSTFPLAPQALSPLLSLNVCF